MPKENLHRKALDLLKPAYKDGFAPAGLGEIQAFLMSEGLRRSQVGKHRVGEWDRQARYELADELISVTSPVRRNGYLRNPNAAPSDRLISRDQLARDLATRATNIKRQMHSDASQVDASRREIERDLRLSIATEILRELV